MDRIKPIETRYNGHRFRSRLEARWAVFFDHAQIKYAYEPEGFNLPSGANYLPDFYLPDFLVYVEIKPRIESIELQDLAKLAEFSYFKNKTVLIIGTPGEHRMMLLDKYFYSYLEYVLECKPAFDSIVKKTLENVYEVEFGSTPNGPLDRWELIYARLSGNSYPLINSAIEEARGKRFEFGEG